MLARLKAQSVRRHKLEPIFLHSSGDSYDDVVFNLVLACFLFLAKPGTSHEQCARRAKILGATLWSGLDVLPSYPDGADSLCHLSCVACACGETFHVGTGLWGMKSHCPSCAGQKAKYFAATERGILIQEFQFLCIPRIWTEYACCIAIQLHKLRAQALNSAPVQESRNV